MRYLFIAEKADVMKKVEAVYKKYKAQVMNSIGEIDFVALTGHVCRYLEPKEYPDWQNQKWHEMNLPLVPSNFEVTEIENDFKKKKIDGVKTALKNKRYDGIIVGTDADTEGNGIYYLLCQKLKLKKYKTLRFYEESLTEREILKSLASMTDFYKEPRDLQMTDAFLLRSRFDWLLGMNGTIAVTRKAGTLFKVGRVKAEVMNIVYENSNACDRFVPHSDYEVHAIYQDGFSGVMVESGKPVSFEKKTDAEQYIADSLDGKNHVTVTSIERKKVRTAPPQLYKLSTLQVDAGSKFNLSPQEVLDLVQALYEKGFVSYPRTDGEYISTQKAKELPTLVKAAEKVPELAPFIQGFQKADLERALNNKHFVNDEEVKKASHDALLPTAVKFDLNSLPPMEQEIYSLICKRLVAQFFKELEEEKTTLDAETDGILFHSTGSTVTEPGWTQLIPKKNTAAVIPNGIRKGDTLAVVSFSAHEKKAAPPKRLTLATLVSAMEGIAKFISDKALKKVFVQAKGIGTPATRGAIINDLITSGYIESRGKNNLLYITDSGRDYIKALSNLSIIRPEQAAEWESYFQAVKTGVMTLTEGEKLCFGYVYDMITEVNKMPDPPRRAAPGKIVAGCQCPYCGKPVLDGKWSYHCEGYKTDCNFSVNKADGKFTEKHLNELLKKGRTGVIKKLVHSQKTGKDYDAALVLEPKGSQYATKIEMPDLPGKATQGKTIAGCQCPYCGKPVLDDKWSYHCEGYKAGCNFSVNKSDGKFTEKHLDELIKKGRTGVIKNIIHSQKTGQDYDASVVLEPKGSQYATKLEFPKTGQESSGSAGGSRNFGSRPGTGGGTRRSASA